MMTTIKHAAANEKVEGIFLQDSYTTKAGNFAAFMPLGVQRWYIQGQLKHLLPDSGSWKVQAAVRIRKIGDVPSGETAFVMGIGEENRAVLVCELEDEQYHLKFLPGSGYPGGTDGTVYFTNTNDKIALYVDYLLAVKNQPGD